MSPWAIERKIMGKPFWWQGRENAVPWTNKKKNRQVWMTEVEAKTSKKMRAIKGKVINVSR